MQRRTFFLGLLLVIVISVAVYFTFFYSYKCDSIACFREHQARCNFVSSKTTFLNDLDDATWLYQVKGRTGDSCRIDVKLVQVKKGDASFTQLEGQTMSCYLDIGSIASPEADISKCHGILKESLQETIINKLHKYIVENLGDIGEELNKPF